MSYLMKILCTITINIFIRSYFLIFVSYAAIQLYRLLIIFLSRNHSILSLAVLSIVKLYYLYIYFRSEIHLVTYYLNKIFFNDFDRPNKVMIECSETTEGFMGK